ncbi:hypothetical protein FPV67DRAFT_312327 [Lyophyllum atratum]|nr:hypothetical protein FPV67DRAFT_312327 [Lyophyllum atratum]
MHKDLNSFKWGDKIMQEYWTKFNRTPPRNLPNKDNAAVLANRSKGLGAPSAAEKRAEEVSKRGGSHTVMLGGLICRNKDSKKGQQSKYDIFMEGSVGHRVPYPDVSNTRYGSHGEGAATIVVYREHLIKFMVHLRETKSQKQEFTNIEKNFALAIEEEQTFSELHAMALYAVKISRPFMRHVRKHGNILELGPFFAKKIQVLDDVGKNPKLWTARDAVPISGALDEELDPWSLTVIEAVRLHAEALPDLDGLVAAFVVGARSALSERFMDEFAPGGDIDTLTPEKRKELFFASTNDANEGNLGILRGSKRVRPNEVLHKFNARIVTSQNETEDFKAAMLTTEEDERYERQVARQRDSAGLQRQLKEAQLRADEAKATENRRKETVRQEKRDHRAAIITETGQNLVLDDTEIEKLTVSELNRQLDFHREEEKKTASASATTERVPLKTHMGNKAERLAELKKAASSSTSGRCGGGFGKH